MMFLRYLDGDEMILLLKVVNGKLRHLDFVIRVVFSTGIFLSSIHVECRFQIISINRLMFIFGIIYIYC